MLLRKFVLLMVLIFSPSNVESIWDNIYQHNKGNINTGSILKICFNYSPLLREVVTPPPLLRRRSSTDTNGQLLDTDLQQVPSSSVTPKSFSQIFTGHVYEDPPGSLVLVKKQDFVPLEPTENHQLKLPIEGSQDAAAVVYSRGQDLFLPPPQNHKVEKDHDATVKYSSGQDLFFVTPTSPTATTTLRPVFVTSQYAPPQVQPSIRSSDAPSSIVVLSRDRQIHRPQDDMMFVTPRGDTLPTATPRPRVSISSTPAPDILVDKPTPGVPASGSVPKSWSITDYDPRKKRRKKEFGVLTSTRKSSMEPIYVTTTAAPTTTTTTSQPALPKENSRMHLQTTSESVIEKLREDYKKRREFLENLQSKRRSDFGVMTASSTTISPRSSSATTTTFAQLISDHEEPYTKRPSLTFVEDEEPDQAEDRSYFVTPMVKLKDSHSYYEELTTPYTPSETHYHLVEDKPSSSYLPPTTKRPAYLPTKKPVIYSTVIPLSSTTTTYPSVTVKATQAYEPSLPPTSLTPPVYNLVTQAPTVATTQASVVTTAGAIIIPKDVLSSIAGPIIQPPSQNGYVAPAVIVLQPQTSTTTTTTTTEAPMQKEAGTDIIFPDDPIIVNTTNQGLTTTPYGRISNTITDEITERLQGSGEVNVALNDTLASEGSVQQSINLKINVYVESDDRGSGEKDMASDSVPKASTNPSVVVKSNQQLWKRDRGDASELVQSLTLDHPDEFLTDTQASPLTYTSSSSFRKPAEAAAVGPSPATADDYLYDSELNHQDYYYYDEFPEVVVDKDVIGNKQGKLSREEIDLTDVELFELYDDLSDIIVEVEEALQKKIPTTTTTTTAAPVRLRPQEIYDYISSKPLKRPRKKWPRKDKVHAQKMPSNDQGSIFTKSQSSTAFRNDFNAQEYYPAIATPPKEAIAPFTNKDLLEPVYPLQSARGPKRKRKWAHPKRRPKTYFYEQAGNFYNLTKELIPDLHGVVKPHQWNVRDFSGWEKMFAPRMGPTAEKATEPPSVREVRPRQQSRPEKFRQDAAVTFDKLLKRSPRRQQMKFSRLIRHDNYKLRSRHDDEGDVYRLVDALSKRNGYYLPTEPRTPRDNFSRETFAAAPPPLPTFDVSFEDWLSDSGVTTSSRRHSFLERGDVSNAWYIHHQPEGYFYRRR